MNEQQAQFFGGPRECPIENGRIQVQRITAKISDVGGIPVARAIPQKDRRLIGLGASSTILALSPTAPY